MLGKPLPYDTLDAAARAQLVADQPALRAASTRSTPAAWGAFGTAGRRRREPFRSPIANFYLTDPISRASEHHGGVHATFVAARRPERRADMARHG